MALPVSTSRELETLIVEMSPHCGAAEIILSGKDYDRLVSRLALIRKLAVNDERELGAWRMADAARAGRTVVDQVSAEQLTQFAAAADNKVVRPDFGRKP